MAMSIIKLKERLLLLHTHFFRSLYRRTFSSQNQGPSENEKSKPIPKPAKIADNADKWLNIKAGIFGPHDLRLPLPGDVGMSQNLIPVELRSPPMLDTNTSTATSVATNFDDTDQFETLLESFVMEVSSHVHEKRETLECKVQTCPKLLVKDFQSLFPHTNFRNENLTVLTMCQKTKNDMSGWSEMVEAEREMLIEVFVDTATKLCETLMTQGYWADFIDPTSGRPYLSPYTNSTLFETDERFRHFGFSIDDLGCCKVVTHHKWGANIFVGAIFTNAPVNSDVLEDSLEHYELLPGDYIKS